MKKQNIILIILFSWLAILACCNLLTCNNDPRIAENNNNWKKIKKADKVYKEQVEVLQQHSLLLNKALSKTEKILETVKSDNKQLRLALQHKIRRQELLKDKQDTAGMLSNCDSLQQQAANYIVISEQQDSLQENSKQSLRVQIATKDSIIAIKDSQYHLAATAVTDYRLQLRKMKRRNNLKTIAIAVVSVLGISSLLHR